MQLEGGTFSIIGKSLSDLRLLNEPIDSPLIQF